MLEEKVGHKMEILEDGIIQVCEVTSILKDGEVVARTLHRHVLCPGDDTAKQVDKVIAVANAVWTKEVIDDYKKKIAVGDIKTTKLK